MFVFIVPEHSELVTEYAMVDLFRSYASNQLVQKMPVMLGQRNQLGGDIAVVYAGKTPVGGAPVADLITCSAPKIYVFCFQASDEFEQVLTTARHLDILDNNELIIFLEISANASRNYVSDEEGRGLAKQHALLAYCKIDMSDLSTIRGSFDLIRDIHQLYFRSSVLLRSNQYCHMVSEDGKPLLFKSEDVKRLVLMYGFYKFYRQGNLNFTRYCIGAMDRKYKRGIPVISDCLLRASFGDPPNQELARLQHVLTSQHAHFAPVRLPIPVEHNVQTYCPSDKSGEKPADASSLGAELFARIRAVFVGKTTKQQRDATGLVFALLQKGADPTIKTGWMWGSCVSYLMKRKHVPAELLALVAAYDLSGELSKRIYTSDVPRNWRFIFSAPARQLPAAVPPGLPISAFPKLSATIPRSSTTQVSARTQVQSALEAKTPQKDPTGQQNPPPDSNASPVSSVETSAPRVEIQAKMRSFAIDGTLKGQSEPPVFVSSHLGVQPRPSVAIPQANTASASTHAQVQRELEVKASLEDPTERQNPQPDSNVSSVNTIEANALRTELQTKMRSEIDNALKKQRLDCLRSEIALLRAESASAHSGSSDTLQRITVLEQSAKALQEQCEFLETCVRSSAEKHRQLSHIQSKRHPQLRAYYNLLRCQLSAYLVGCWLTNHSNIARKKTATQHGFEFGTTVCKALPVVGSLGFIGEAGFHAAELVAHSASEAAHLTEALVGAFETLTPSSIEERLKHMVVHSQGQSHGAVRRMTSSLAHSLFMPRVFEEGRSAKLGDQLADMDVLAEEIARQLTLRYEQQILMCTPKGAEKLARFGVQRMVTTIKMGRLTLHDDTTNLELQTQIIRQLVVSVRSRQLTPTLESTGLKGTIELTNDAKVQHNIRSARESHLYTSCGLKTSDGEMFADTQCDIRRYGCCLAYDEKEVSGLTQCTTRLLVTGAVERIAAREADPNRASVRRQAHSQSIQDLQAQNRDLQAQIDALKVIVVQLTVDRQDESKLADPENAQAEPERPELH